jgi:hypothetical protein
MVHTFGLVGTGMAVTSLEAAWSSESMVEHPAAGSAALGIG